MQFALLGESSGVRQIRWSGGAADPPDEPSSQLPDSLHDVQLEKLLARGGFGEVHRARWRGAEVAVKVSIRLLVALDAEARAPLHAAGTSAGSWLQVIKAWVDPCSADLAGPLLEGLLRSASVLCQVQLRCAPPMGSETSAASHTSTARQACTQPCPPVPLLIPQQEPEPPQHSADLQVWYPHP